jgi:hypothetical protein
LFGILLLKNAKFKQQENKFWKQLRENDKKKKGHKVLLMSENMFYLLDMLNTNFRREADEGEFTGDFRNFRRKF